MIRLNVPYEEKDDAKRLGAKWNGYGRYWYIENDDDYSLFSAWLSEEELDVLRTMPSYALSDYMALIKEQTIFTAELTQPAKIIGDVYSHYLKQNNLFLELTDTIHGKERLPVYHPKYYGDAKDLQDARVVVTGSMQIYQGHMQVIASNIDILAGEATKRCQQIQEWNESCLPYYPAKPSSNRLLKPFSILHIISSPSGAGYDDFCKNVLRKKENMPKYMDAPRPFRITNHFMTLTAENISNAIAEINVTEPFPACICIIRGGGNEYDLVDFNHAILVQTIAASALPVICAIGHTKDTFLIDQIVDRAFDTPTQAGTYLFYHLLCWEWLTEKEKFQKISSEISALCEKHNITGLKWRIYKKLQAILNGFFT